MKGKVGRCSGWKRTHCAMRSATRFSILEVRDMPNMANRMQVPNAYTSLAGDGSAFLRISGATCISGGGRSSLESQGKDTGAIILKTLTSELVVVMTLERLSEPCTQVCLLPECMYAMPCAISRAIRTRFLKERLVVASSWSRVASTRSVTRNWRPRSDVTPRICTIDGWRSDASASTSRWLSDLSLETDTLVPHQKPFISWLDDVAVSGPLRGEMRISEGRISGMDAAFTGSSAGNMPRSVGMSELCRDSWNASTAGRSMSRSSTYSESSDPVRTSRSASITAPCADLLSWRLALSMSSL
mmetsp:Transcript_32699/g.81988  ORF Transcript_32699/g.81988 Transcript_32699/m.81988 type:complete len:301 (+) Transcript_32699:2517-3419(+)